MFSFVVQLINFFFVMLISVMTSAKYTKNFYLNNSAHKIALTRTIVNVT